MPSRKLNLLNDLFKVHHIKAIFNFIKIIKNQQLFFVFLYDIMKTEQQKDVIYMATIDFTDKTFNSIKLQNSKDYKQAEQALMDHFCDEMKKFFVCYDPLCVVYAWHWLREIINEMKNNRKNPNSDYASC